MHEMSLMEGILQRAKTALEPYQVEKVNSLEVRTGVMANIIPSAFEFAFTAQSKDTIFEGAELIVVKLPIGAHCPTCDNEFTSWDLPLVCPKCAETIVAITSGSEVYLINIDFEEEGEADES